MSTLVRPNLSELRDWLNHLESLAPEYGKGLDWIGLRLILENANSYELKNESLKESRRELNIGIRVEILYRGQFYYVGSPNVSRAGAVEAFNKALDLGRRTSDYRLFDFSSRQRPGHIGTYKTPHQKSLDALDPKRILQVLGEASKALNKSGKVSSRSAFARNLEAEHLSVSSSGESIEQDFSLVFLGFVATATEGTEAQSRSLHGESSLAYQMGSEVYSLHRLVPQCELVGEQAYELLKSPNCPQVRTDVLIAPDQMMLQIHESVGHPLEIDRILGDERNYAGWSFVKAEDFGNLQYGSSLMNIVFEPNRFGEFASYGFDDSGSPAERVYLIRDGKLLAGLGGLESQARSSLPGVANFRSSSWNRAPIDRMANVNLEPGTEDLNSILARIEDGILMQSNRSWSIDDYRDNFQFGCEYAVKIEKGQIKNALKNPNYRGRTLEFWKSLKAISREHETYGTPWCGKGEPSQVIRVGHASPYALFSDVEVFGR